jgi:hypothetical protein
MKSVFILFFACCCLLICSCEKAGTITVTVKKQSTGQPIQIGDSIIVLVKNTSNTSKFYMQLTSSQGVAVFDNVDNASYRISSEMWDGSRGLYDERVVEMKNGKHLDIDLLIQ